jgi:Fe-S-cluster-containing hydrogenase component 2
MGQYIISRNKDICIGCNECLIVCPQSHPDDKYSVLVAAEKRGESPEVNHSENCIQCFRCLDHCRCGAISFEGAHVVEILVNNEEMEQAVRRII